MGTTVMAGGRVELEARRVVKAARQGAPTPLAQSTRIGCGMGFLESWMTFQRYSTG